MARRDLGIRLARNDRGREEPDVLDIGVDLVEVAQRRNRRGSRPEHVEPRREGMQSEWRKVELLAQILGKTSRKTIDRAATPKRDPHTILDSTHLVDELHDATRGRIRHQIPRTLSAHVDYVDLLAVQLELVRDSLLQQDVSRRLEPNESPSCCARDLRIDGFPGDGATEPLFC